MGMCLALHSVSDKNIEKILAFPPLIWRLIAQDDAEIYLQSVRENSNIGFLSGLFGNKKAHDAEQIPVLEFVVGENIADDIDKSWQGLHYCLNKTQFDAVPPMDFMTVGGKNAGDIEVGYGPARLIDSQTVKEIEKQIAQISLETLNQNYQPAEMDKFDIYPNIWERDGEEGFEYISEYFAILKSFLAHCVKHNLGMALYLC